MTATAETEKAEEQTSTNGQPPRQFLSAADIRAREDTKYDEFQVPAWENAWVRIRSLTSKERDKYEEDVTQQKNGKATTNLKNARAKLVVMVLVDGAGNRIMGDRDIETLGGKNSDAINTIFRRACKLSGILQTEQDMEEAVGNSETTRDDDS